MSPDGGLAVRWKFIPTTELEVLGSVGPWAATKAQLAHHQPEINAVNGLHSEQVPEQDSGTQPLCAAVLYTLPSAGPVM